MPITPEQSESVTETSFTNSSAHIRPDINWYPGHMLKAKKALVSQLKRVDVVLELRDARIPLASMNHDFEDLLSHKHRIVLFNKTDLANSNTTAAWQSYFQSQKGHFLFIDSKQKQNRTLKKVLPLARKIMREKWETYKKKGIRPPSLKLMIVGVPNVGKSTLINRMVKRHAAETGSKPGVTRHTTWVKLGKDTELLDTPGILWPKIESADAGLALTLTGAIRDSVVDSKRLIEFLIQSCQNSRPDVFQKRYNLPSNFQKLPSAEIINAVAVHRGCIKEKGVVDRNRAIDLMLRDFREGNLGRISLEKPDNDDQTMD